MGKSVKVRLKYFTKAKKISILNELNISDLVEMRFRTVAKNVILQNYIKSEWERWVTFLIYSLVGKN